MPAVESRTTVNMYYLLLVDFGSDRVKVTLRGWATNQRTWLLTPNRIALIGGTSNRQMVLVPRCQHTYKGWGPGYL